MHCRALSFDSRDFINFWGAKVSVTGDELDSFHFRLLFHVFWWVSIFSVFYILLISLQLKSPSLSCYLYVTTVDWCWFPEKQQDFKKGLRKEIVKKEKSFKFGSYVKSKILNKKIGMSDSSVVPWAWSLNCIFNFRPLLAYCSAKIFAKGWILGWKFDYLDIGLASSY